jgi:hypothetical protein
LETVVSVHRFVATVLVDLELSFLICPVVLVVQVNRVTEILPDGKSWGDKFAAVATGIVV